MTPDADDQPNSAPPRATRSLSTYDRALAMLAAQPRSVADLRRRLKRREEDPASIEEAIARLTERGLLDDAAYARLYMRSSVVSKGVSVRRTRQVLAKRGVASQHADAAIAALRDEAPVDEEANALRAARKKLRTLGISDPAARRRQLYGYLARRGYDSDDIRRAMTQLLDASDTEEVEGDSAP